MIARFISFFSFCLLVLAAFADVSAQQPTQPSKGNCTISGHVTIEDKDAAGVLVMLKKGGNDYDNDWGKVLAKTKTDDKGNYQLTNISAGSYNLTPQASAFVVTNAQERLFFFGTIGKSITIKDGENIKGMDFNLVRGGVITGRVTDREGKPVISQKVALWTIDDKGQKQPLRDINYWIGTTDDRGIYRYYGLKPGRYLVSVGLDPKGSDRANWNRRTFYPRTFYPNTQNQDEATFVEVSTGSEVADIDIRVGPRAISYEISGRVINEETNQPVQGAYVGATAVKEGEQKTIGYSFFGGGNTNDKGEFKINGVMQGKYKLGLIFQQKSAVYSPEVIVEVKDADLKDVVIKAKRGQSISGVVTFENMSTMPPPAKLENMTISAFIMTQGSGLPVQSMSQVAADGSFTISGLKEGKVQLYIERLPKGFHIFRVEHNGVPQKDGVIELSPNESAQGVRVHVVYGNCVLRGEVKVEGGKIPDDSMLIVRLRRTDGAQVNSYGEFPDALGRFVIDGLPPGEYEVTASVYKKAINEPSVSEPKPSVSSKQTVTVSNGVEANVTLSVNVGGGTQP